MMNDKESNDIVLTSEEKGLEGVERVKTGFKSIRASLFGDDNHTVLENQKNSENSSENNHHHQQQQQMSSSTPTQYIKDDEGQQQLEVEVEQKSQDEHLQDQHQNTMKTYDRHSNKANQRVLAILGAARVYPQAPPSAATRKRLEQNEERKTSPTDKYLLDDQEVNMCVCLFACVCVCVCASCFALLCFHTVLKHTYTL